MSNNSETTGTDNNTAFNAWADRIEKLDDMSASRELFNHIMTKSDIDEESKGLLSSAYEYCIRLIKEGKPLDPHLLKIQLQDIKGYDISQVSYVNLICLLGCCGITFTK